MSPKDARKVPLVEGQTDLGWGRDEVEPTDDDVVFVCRSCHSTRITGPIKRTVDPRWVHATCLDCGERVIANVHVIRIMQEAGEGDPIP